MSIKLVIDPGAAETYAAVIAGEKSELVRLGKYQYGIPTAVCLTPDGVLHFGEAAEKMAEVHPAGYCRAFVRKLGSSAKLLMGRYTAADLLGKFLAYVFPLVKESYGCAEVGAVDVVLCCPVSLTTNQQAELRAAALMAGARAVELVTDTGAIYCVWADRLRNRGLAPLFEKNALLVNWSPARVEYVHMVTEAAGGKINPRAVGGLVELGGEEIDEDLANYIMAKVARMRPVGRVAWPALLRQVREQCPVRDAQRALSTQQLNVRSFLIAGHTVEVQIPGEDYARLLAPYLERMASAVKSLYMSALGYGKPEVVLITGDLALLPGVQKILAETLGLPVFYRTKPTDAVEGAALYLKQNGALSMSQQAQQPALKEQSVALPVPEPVEAQSALREALHAQQDAVEAEHLDCSESLVAHGAELQGEPGQGTAASLSTDGDDLCQAMKNGNVNELIAVLAVGADVNSPDESGNYPLMYAVLTGHADCVRVLLNYGAQVDLTDRQGYTPLHVALRAPNPDCLSALIEAGANVNRFTPNGWTPLGYAAMRNHADCVRLLLKAPGITPDALNAYGETALHVAEKYGHEECARLLRKAARS